MILHRMISPDIEIGIRSGEQASQALRFRGSCYNLVAHQVFEDKLSFQFEDQIFLDICVGYKNSFNFKLRTPSEIHIGQIPPIIVNSYKPLSMSSSGDLDKIYDFIRIHANSYKQK